MYNSMWSAAGLDETGDTSLFNGVTDVARFAGSAALSGVQSIANTGIAFANALGGNYESYDTRETLENLGLDETAQYYSKHKGAVDTAGFIATSLIPGSLGVKAARAAISFGAGRSIKFVAGLADVVDESRRASIISNAARAGYTKSAFAERNALIAKGFGTQAIEGLAFETAVNLTMNQNATMEPTSKDYFDSVAQNFTSGTFWTGALVGGAIGGSVEAGRTFFGFKKAAQAANANLNKLMGVQTTGELKVLGGDSLLTAFNGWEKQKANIGEFVGKADELAARNNMKQQESILDDALFNFSGKDPAVMQKIKGFLINDKIPYERKVELLSGARNLTAPYESEYKSVVKSVATNVWDDIDEAADLTGTLMFRQFQDAGITYKSEAQLKEMYKSTFKEMADNFGFATMAVGKNGQRIGVATVNRLLTETRKATIASIGGDTNVTAAMLRASTPEALAARVNAAYEVGGQRGLMSTLLHEKGHLITDWLTGETFGGDALTAKIQKELESLSRLARPTHWQAYDNALEIKNNPSRFNALSAQEQRELDAHISYMKSPKEMWADSFAMLEGEHAEALRLLAKSTTGILMQNGALSKMFSPIKRVINLDTGVLNNRTGFFTAADYGVKDLGSKNNGTSHFIEMAGGRYMVDVNKTFNPLEVTARDAAAHMWAWMNKGSKLKLTDAAIEYGDIPRLTRAIAEFQNPVSPRLGIKVKSAEGVEFEIQDANLLDEFVRNTKQDFFHRMSGQRYNDPETGLPRFYDHMEIARTLDTSENWALGNFAEDAYDSLTHNVGDARHTIIRYDRKAMRDFKGIAADVAYQERIAIAKAHADSLAADLFGSMASSLPSRVRQTFEAGKSLAQDVSQFDTGSGLLMYANGEYTSGAGAAQQIGVVLNNKQQQVSKLIRQEYEGHAVAITSNRKSLAEMNTFDAWHRGHKEVYMFNSPEYNPPRMYANLLDALQVAKPEEAAAIQANIAKLQPVVAAIQDAGLSEWFNNAGRRFASSEAIKSFDALINSTPTDPIAWGTWYKAQVNDALTGSKIIDVQDDNVFNFLSKYIGDNNKYASQRMMIQNAMGKSGRFKDGRVYLGAARTDRSPYFAFVTKDHHEGVTSSPDVGMVSAMTADGLTQKIEQLQAKFGDSVRITTEKERERFLRLRKEWDESKRHGDLNIQSDLERNGFLAEVLPEMNPLAVHDAIDSLVNLATNNLRSSVALKYGEELAELRAYGAAHTLAAQSRFGASKANVKAGNAWAEQERMMLNLSNTQSDSKWLDFQTHTDEAVTKVFNGLSSTFRHFVGKGNYSDAAFAEMEESMKRYNFTGPLDPKNPGLRDVWVNAGMEHRGALRKVSTLFNSITANMMLRLDAANALVNAMSTPITTAPELRMLWNELNTAGRFVDTIAVPETAHKMPAPAKVMFQAVQDLWQKPEIVEDYIQRGIIPKDLRAVFEAGDMLSVVAGDLTNANKSTIGKVINSSIAPLKLVADKVGKLSDLSEKFTYAVAARSAEIMMDASGVGLSQGTRNAIIARFGTRVNGNYVAAQRPTLFQGWAGQAIGLFQTYGMNMYNNIFRYAGTDKKALAAMAAAQTSIFGAQSVPGFDTLNQLVWEKTTGEQDLHSSMHNLMGRDLAEWVLYGAASNMTKPVFGDGIALYTRGEVAPMNSTIIPTSLDELPAYRSVAKTLGAIVDSVGMAAGGVDASTAFFNALATQGLSRPLQGLGQIAKGEVTSGQGNRLYQVDALNWWSTATRLMGAKPLNDAIAQESYYRMRNYKAAAEDAALQSFKTIDLAVRTGQSPSTDMVNDAMQSYLKAGHSGEAFQRKLMATMMNLHEGELAKMRDELNSSEGRYMLNVMSH